MISPEEKNKDLEGNEDVGRKRAAIGKETQSEDIGENNNLSELSDCVSSDVSDNSDWSDDEREILEKQFGAMSERGKECEKIRNLRKSRRHSRRAQQSLGASNWEIAKLVYSRDSSLSGLTVSSLNSSTVELDRRSINDGDSSLAGLSETEKIHGEGP